MRRHPGPQLRDQVVAGRVPAVADLEPGRMSEEQPDQVALFGRDAVEVVDQIVVRPVVGEQIEPGRAHQRGERIELVEDVLEVIGQHRAIGVGGERCDAGQPKQMLSLLVVHPQGARHRLPDLRRRVDVPALLEPGVPGHADGGELGDLLAPEPWRTAAAARWEADILRGDAFTAAAQKSRQLVSARLATVAGRIHLAMVTHHRASYQGGTDTWISRLSLPGTKSAHYR